VSQCLEPRPRIYPDLSDQDPDDSEVTPPLAIQDHGQVLREIMVVYESSLLEGETPEQQASGAKGIMDSMVDPAIEMCLTVSEEKHKLRPKWDYRVFVLNCLTYVKVCGRCLTPRKSDLTAPTECD